MAVDQMDQSPAKKWYSMDLLEVLQLSAESLPMHWGASISAAAAALTNLAALA